MICLNYLAQSKRIPGMLSESPPRSGTWPYCWLSSLAFDELGDYKHSLAWRIVTRPWPHLQHCVRFFFFPFFPLFPPWIFFPLLRRQRNSTWYWSHMLIIKCRSHFVSLNTDHEPFSRTQCLKKVIYSFHPKHLLIAKHRLIHVQPMG